MIQSGVRDVRADIRGNLNDADIDPESVNRLLPRSMTTFALVASLTMSSCGSDGGGSSLPGESIARSNGCASCHGGDFSGGVGPSWRNLAGSEVALSDGATVRADRAYLIESIKDPNAKHVAGYSASMPTNSLSDADVQRIVDFIQSLSEVK